ASRPHHRPDDAGPRGQGRGRAGAAMEARRRGVSAVRGIPGEDHATDPGVHRRAQTLEERATVKVVDAIARILKIAGTDFLSAYPTTAVIEAAAKADIGPVLGRPARRWSRAPPTS